MATQTDTTTADEIAAIVQMLDVSNVDAVHSDVKAAIARWSLIRDCIAGPEAIKAGGAQYLPLPDPKDFSQDARDRYAQYIERAVFYPVTGRTHASLVGQVYHVDPKLTLPTKLEVLRADTDGAGVGLVQQSKRTLGSVLAFGRAGLLADYPDSPTPASVGDALSGRIRPIIINYDPWDIINYDTITDGALKKLSLVVLKEKATERVDMFTSTVCDQWRVLFLNSAGLYVQVVVKITDVKDNTKSIVGVYLPRDASGSRMREIPFTFVGSVNNDTLLDPAPMYDIADLNVAHYRNSADSEESCFIAGQPTPVAIGVSDGWVKKHLDSGIKFGTRRLIPLPAGADLKIVQASPNNMIDAAMNRKEQQMVALGARLLEQRTIRRTATEASIELASEISILGTCSRNTSAAYRKICTWAAAFSGDDAKSIEFDLSADYAIEKLAADERAQLMAEWQGSAISWTEYRKALRAGGGPATDDDAAARSAIKSDPPPAKPSPVSAL